MHCVWWSESDQCEKGKHFISIITNVLPIVQIYICIMASFGLGQAPSTATNLPDIDSSTPWMAVSEGNLSLLQSSLAALSLPTSVADENGYTLLHAAASYNQLEILRFLLNSGVNINATDNDGDTALHYAGALPSLRLLLEHHADPTIVNSQGKTALQAKQEELEEMMEDEDIDEDDDDLEALKAVVQHLSSLQ